LPQAQEVKYRASFANVCTRVESCFPHLQSKCGRSSHKERQARANTITMLIESLGGFKWQAYLQQLF
jgi:hypothetical protein